MMQTIARMNGIPKRDAGLQRKEIYPVGEILYKVKQARQNDMEYIELDGDRINALSDRYHTFLVRGVECKCGLQGAYFAKERFSNHNRYHLNLYAIDADGDEVLMTKDHVVPKSLGGKDHISNYDTMCKVCNGTKGNKIVGQRELGMYIKLKLFRGKRR